MSIFQIFTHIMSANISLAKASHMIKLDSVGWGNIFCSQGNIYLLNNNLNCYTLLALSSKYSKIIVIKDRSQFRLWEIIFKKGSWSIETLSDISWFTSKVTNRAEVKLNILSTVFAVWLTQIESLNNPQNIWQFYVFHGPYLSLV